MYSVVVVVAVVEVCIKPQPPLLPSLLSSPQSLHLSEEGLVGDGEAPVLGREFEPPFQQRRLGLFVEVRILVVCAIRLRTHGEGGNENGESGRDLGRGRTGQEG